MKPINDPKQIDLKKHGVIEASAGTGKTYTIENLVVRLLVEEGISLDRILLVTFTEKATGEMGQRIRANIEKALGSGNYSEEQKFPLQTALDRFDEASIQTIHGFCQKMLRLYALENGMPYETEVVDDIPLYESCLHDLMRKGWQERFGLPFENLLRMSGFQGSVKDRKDWEANILEIARSYQPSIGNRLHPAPPEDLAGFLAGFQSKFEKRVDEARQLVGDGGKIAIESHPFYEGYAALNFRTNSKTPLLTKIVRPILRFLTQYEGGQSGWRGFLDLIEEAKTASKFEKVDCSFEALLPSEWSKGGDNLDKVCPHLPRLVGILEDIRKMEPNKQVFAGLIEDLKGEVNRLKSDRGAIGFDDMILRFHAALQPSNPASERFLRELRGRYVYALVDEFQDTDPAQWGIFGRVFLESPRNNRLFIIGDPKQAIYRFRGADVNTYLRAKEAILGHPSGAGYSLAVNWRSTPEMIGVFNRVFSTPSLWFRKGSRIEHFDVAPPGEGQRRSALLEDPTGTHALTLVRMPDELGFRACKFAYFRWIAGEIARLIRYREKFRIRTLSNDRPLELHDLCVLVRTRKEAEEFQEVLGRKIPSTVYKKSGLYESREAFHLSRLLRALADPDASRMWAALLTDFFRVPPDRLRDLAHSDGSLPYQDLFSKWWEWTAARNWPALFHSILSETQVLIERDEAGTVHPPDERSWTNYQHLIQNIETEASLHGWDIEDMVVILDRYRKRTVEVSADSELHRLESETPKVQIMTLHVAKGLEFPVVFIAGGITGGNRVESHYKFHDGEAGQIVYDLAKSPPNKERVDTEEKDEMSRLYYVGLTRAQHKLYLPTFGERTLKGSPGPLVTQVGVAIEEAIARTGLTDVSVVDPKEPWTEATLEFRGGANEREPILPTPLFLSTDSDFSNRKMEAFSFTRLAHSLPSVGTSHQYGQTREKEQDEANGSEWEIEVPEKEPLLPKGERTGSMMHEVFEQISYQEVFETESPEHLFEGAAGAREIAENLVERYRIASPLQWDRFEICVKEVLRWTWNALHLSLPIGDGFYLGQLPPRDRQHEMEFFYPLPDSSKCRLTAAQLKSLSIEQEVAGFLNGFIDLIFRVDGRYFLLDWKTNSLSDYSTDSVVQSMRENHYPLQFEIYSIALHRLLSMSLPAYDPESHFGGVFYLYLRGIDPNRPGQGVYWRDASQMKSIAEVERSLFDRVHGREASSEVAG